MLYKILKYTVNWVCHTFSEHNLCYLTYIFIIILAPLSLGQYLDYIENVSVKSFVLVPIELLLLLFTFHCTVQDHTTFLWQKVYFVADGYSVLAYVTASAHVSNDAFDTTCIETVAQQGWYHAALLSIRQYLDYLENIMSKELHVFFFTWLTCQPQSLTLLTSRKTRDYLQQNISLAAC